MLSRADNSYSESSVCSNFISKFLGANPEFGRIPNDCIDYDVVFPSL